MSSGLAVSERGALTEAGCDLDEVVIALHPRTGEVLWRSPRASLLGVAREGRVLSRLLDNDAEHARIHSELLPGLVMGVRSVTVDDHALLAVLGRRATAHCEVQIVGRRRITIRRDSTDDVVLDQEDFSAPWQAAVVTMLSSHNTPASPLAVAGVLWPAEDLARQTALLRSNLTRFVKAYAELRPGAQPILRTRQSWLSMNRNEIALDLFSLVDAAAETRLLREQGEDVPARRMAVAALLTHLPERGQLQIEAGSMIAQRMLDDAVSSLVVSSHTEDVRLVPLVRRALDAVRAPGALLTCLRVLARYELDEAQARYWSQYVPVAGDGPVPIEELVR